MLILSRRLTEKLLIGKAGEVQISVLSIRGNQVKLGITAPRDTPVNREEIYFLKNKRIAEGV